MNDPLIGFIKRAFTNLGAGRHHLKEIYQEVERLDYPLGGRDLRKAIRKRIYEHSSDSPQHAANAADLFHSAELGSGFWQMRQGESGALDPAALHDDDADGGGSSYIPQAGEWRKLVNRQIRERRGQRAFRDSVRRRYGDQCVVTGCTVLAVLEAAHIRPYRGEHDNDPANGLLLRADIHTLFDLALLTIEPDELTVVLHPKIARAAEYYALCAKTLTWPRNAKPSAEALRVRFAQFQESL